MDIGTGIATSTGILGFIVVVLKLLSNRNHKNNTNPGTTFQDLQNTFVTKELCGKEHKAVGDFIVRINKNVTKLFSLHDEIMKCILKIGVNKK